MEWRISICISKGGSSEEGGAGSSPELIASYPRTRASLYSPLIVRAEK